MKALSGIRVLDLTHMLAGPYATMVLADLGAETIKVEPPGQGEKTRGLLTDDLRNSLHGMGAYFLALNRNKKSVAIDLKSRPGRDLFCDLVRVADAVVCNFSPGVATRLEIDHDHLAEVNPRIVTCSITGFGESGPNRDLVSFDMVAQATGGGMSLTGMAGGPPLRAGLPIADLGASLMAVIGVLSALRAVSCTGRGQHVDISLQDGQVSMLSYVAVMNALSGFDPGRMGNAHFVHVPYDTYRASDGWLIVAVVFDAAWLRLLEVVACPDLDTESNRTKAGRLENREIIDRRLGERFATAPRAHWLAKLQAARIPCAPVHDIGEALRDPHIRARDMVVALPHPAGGSVEVPGNPIKLSQAPQGDYASPPLLGQHTRAILRELLDKSDEDIAALVAAGVIDVVDGP